MLKLKRPGGLAALVICMMLKLSKEEAGFGMERKADQVLIRYRLYGFTFNRMSKGKGNHTYIVFSDWVFFT